MDSFPIVAVEDRPGLFHENNRTFWSFARRFLIYLLRELDKWYGWRTF